MKTTVGKDAKGNAAKGTYVEMPLTLSHKKDGKDNKVREDMYSHTHTDHRVTVMSCFLLFAPPFLVVAGLLPT